jgi:uracil-DNA glycosylase
MTKYDKLFGEGWARILTPFLESDDFKKIGKYLKQQVSDGKKIYPLFDDMFRAFKECPYENLVAVFLTNNAYQSEMDGLAFSVSEPCIDHYPEQLTKIFDAVEQDVARGLYLNRKGDLSRWANQGVLLLNCDLSTERGAKPGAHVELWKPFIEFVLKTLSEYNPGLFYILIGKQATNYQTSINEETNRVCQIEHPMLAVKEKRPWRHKDIFHDVSLFSKFMNNVTIDWTMPYNQKELDKFASSGIKIKKIESYG